MPSSAEESAKKIANLEAEIARYVAKLEAAKTFDEERFYGGLITTSRETLNLLLGQQQPASAAPVGKHLYLPPVHTMQRKIK